MSKPTVNPAVVEAFDVLAGRLARPESWIQRKFAKTGRRGRDVFPEDSKARCWCLQGAIWTLPSGTQMPVAIALIELLPTAGEKNSITAWNDARRRTHAEVLDAIARARAAYIAGGFS